MRPLTRLICNLSFQSRSIVKNL